MGEGVSRDDELKIENSRQLSNVGLVALPLFFTLGNFVIEKREVGPIFWSIAAAAVLSIIGSVFAGGRGIAALRKREGQRGWFDRQAKLGLLGVLLLLGSYFATGSEKREDLPRSLESLVKEIQANRSAYQQQLTQASTHIQLLQQQNQHLTQRIDQLFSVNATLQRDIAQLEARMPRVEAPNAKTPGAK